MKIEETAKITIDYRCKQHHSTTIDIAFGHQLIRKVMCSEQGCTNYAYPRWIEGKPLSNLYLDEHIKAEELSRDAVLKVVDRLLSKIELQKREIHDLKMVSIKVHLDNERMVEALTTIRDMFSGVQGDAGLVLKAMCDEGLNEQ